MSDEKLVITRTQIREALKVHPRSTSRQLCQRMGWPREKAHPISVAMAGMWRTGQLAREECESGMFAYSLSPAFTPSFRGPKVENAWAPPQTVHTAAAVPPQVPGGMVVRVGSLGAGGPVSDPLTAAADYMIARARKLWLKDLADLELRFYAAFGHGSNPTPDAPAPVAPPPVSEPSRPRLPRVVVYKLSAAREQLVKVRFGDKLDLRIYRDEGRPRESQANLAAQVDADFYVITTDICSHSERNALQRNNKRWIVLETGSFERLAGVLTECLNFEAVV